LGAIKGLGRGAIEDMFQARSRNGAFRDLFDLCCRVDTRKANRRSFVALIRAGALDKVGPHRSSQLSSINTALRLAEQEGKTKASGQLQFALFPENSPLTNTRAVDFTVAPEWDETKRLQAEKLSLGLYLSGHPIDRYAEELTHLTSGPLGMLDLTRNRSVVVAGFVVGLRSLVTKKGDRMGIVILDDGTGRIEFTLFGELYFEYHPLLVEEQVLIIEAEVVIDPATEQIRIRAQRVSTITETRTQNAQALVISIDSTSLKPDRIESLKTTLAPHRTGSCPIEVHYCHPKLNAKLALGSDWRVKPSDALVSDLNAWEGKGTVNFRY